MLSQITLIHLFYSPYYHNVQGFHFSLPLLAGHITLKTWHFTKEESIFYFKFLLHGSHQSLDGLLETIDAWQCLSM